MIAKKKSGNIKYKIKSKLFQIKIICILYASKYSNTNYSYFFRLPNILIFPRKNERGYAEGTAWPKNIGHFNDTARR